MLYGCEAWVLRVDQQKRLIATQRKMLRMIINAKGRRLHEMSEGEQQDDHEHDQDNEVTVELEPWANFLKRTARWTEEQMMKSGQKEWQRFWRERQCQ